MEKKIYLKPDFREHKFVPTTILAGSNERYEDGDTSGWFDDDGDDGGGGDGGDDEEFTGTIDPT